MTLLVLFGVLVSLLVLRLVPGLVLQIALAAPRRHLAFVRWVHGRDIGIALPRTSGAAVRNPLLMMRSTSAGGRLKFMLVSSSLLVLAVLVTTAFWTWHSTGLMMLLR
jgi:hypothetical protein